MELVKEAELQESKNAHVNGEIKGDENGRGEIVGAEREGNPSDHEASRKSVDGRDGESAKDGGEPQNEEESEGGDEPKDGGNPEVDDEDSEAKKVSEGKCRVHMWEVTNVGKQERDQLKKDWLLERSRATPTVCKVNFRQVEVRYMGERNLIEEHVTMLAGLLRTHLGREDPVHYMQGILEEDVEWDDENGEFEEDRDGYRVLAEDAVVYLTSGHHRMAALKRIKPEEEDQWWLMEVFPSSEWCSYLSCVVVADEP